MPGSFLLCVPLEDVWSVSRSRQNTDWTHPVESVDTTAVPTSGEWYLVAFCRFENFKCVVTEIFFPFHDTGN
jgi:hypothetical protein